MRVAPARSSLGTVASSSARATIGSAGHSRRAVMVMRTLSESVPATATSARARVDPRAPQGGVGGRVAEQGMRARVAGGHERGVPAIDHHDRNAAADEIRADVLADVAVAADDDVLLERVDSLCSCAASPRSHAARR